MTRTVMTAERVCSGDVVLIDPLDLSTAADVAEVERSQHSTTTGLVMIYRGEIVQSIVQNDQPVSVLR